MSAEGMALLIGLIVSLIGAFGGLWKVVTDARHARLTEAENHAEAMAKLHAEKEQSELLALQAQASAMIEVEKAKTSAQAERADIVGNILDTTNKQLQLVHGDLRELRARVDKLEQEKRDAQADAARLSIENAKLTAKVEGLEADKLRQQERIADLEAAVRLLELEAAGHGIQTDTREIRQTRRRDTGPHPT